MNFEENVVTGRPVGRGVRWVRPHPPPPQTAEVHFFVKKINSKKNAVSDNLSFKISRGGGHAPGPPSKERLRHSLVRIIN